MLRAQKGSGSIRKRGRNSYEGRLMVNGTRTSVYGRTKLIVQEKMDALTKNNRPEISIEDPQADYTLEEWLKKWLDEWLVRVTVNTKKRYEMEVRLHILPDLGSTKLKCLKAAQVQRLYNELYQRGLSAKSVKCAHGVLHTAIDKAVELQLISENVTNRCTVPKQTSNEMKPLKNNDVTRFLEAIKGHRYEDVYYVALFTGMREAELMGLTWDCIDFERGTIKVYRQLQRTNKNGEYTFTRPKNSKS